MSSLKYLYAGNDRDASGGLLQTEVDLSGDDVQEQLAPVTSFLNRLVDSENLIVLAGSGTSLSLNSQIVGQPKTAPSMWDLWNLCKNADDTLFGLVKNAVRYGETAKTNSNGEVVEDIELLLSLCDSYIELNTLSRTRQAQLERFLKLAKKVIFDATNFCEKVPNEKWSAHNRFIRTLSKRTPKQKRLKLFTTNYDLAFEHAASNNGVIVIDGFEFSKPSRFNPAWFNYDIVNRTQANEQTGSYLSNLMHLYKLHGSVDWVKVNGSIRKLTFSEDEDCEPVFIYPSSSKYQSSYDSPYIDMMSAFLETLQKPKTSLLCVGFGFNDKHLNNAISMALRTNPEFNLVVATKDPFNPDGAFNSSVRTMLTNLMTAGDARTMMVDCSFDDLCSLIPERQKVTPEERVYQAIKELVGQ